MSEQMVMHEIVVAKEVDGIEMGVMDDGSAYVTGRGLARLCGVVPSAIIGQAASWEQGKRTNAFAKLVQEHGHTDGLLYTEIPGPKTVHAYPEAVVLAALEYYALDVSPPNAIARNNHRKLTRAGFRLFVYTQLGYDADNRVPLEWREFNDRVRLHSVPRGYFSCFQEMAGLMLAAMRGGLVMDYRTVPDISVGQTWAQHWKAERLEEKYGPRVLHEHNYPAYMPQAQSNPQDMNVYPVDALGEFRRWMDEVYLPAKFPKYIKGKVSRGLLPASSAELLLEAVAPPEQPKLLST